MKHWWFRARKHLVAGYIERLHLPANATILDLGCGTGGTTSFLGKYGNVTGLDMSDQALGAARTRHQGIRFVQGDINKVDESFAPGLFDLITLFNVLCHEWVIDESDVLCRIVRLLRAGGYLLLTEPAFGFLQRRHDRIAMGDTRFTLGQIRMLLSRVGLDCVAGQYFNLLSFPLCLLSAWCERTRPGDEHQGIAELKLPPPMINALLATYFRFEACAARILHIPFGVTLLAVGRKSGKN